MFAAPVTAGEARRLAREARAEKGCTPTGPLRFGRPGSVLVCAGTSFRLLQAAGRLGDSWVHCELRAPTAADPSFPTRGQRWCADVALALALGD